MSSSLPAPGPVPPISTGFTVETLQTWIEDLAYKNRTLEEENKSLKLENQELKTEMEKMSIDIKKYEEENLPSRKLRKIKTEPVGNDENVNDEALEGSQSLDLTNQPDVPNSSQNSGQIQIDSLLMLNERQNQEPDNVLVVLTCHICKNTVKTRHHCIVCEDFNLCVGCYEKQGHPHKMHKIVHETDKDNGFGSNSVSSGNAETSKPPIPPNHVNASIRKVGDLTFLFPSKEKLIIDHSKVCKKRTVDFLMCDILDYMT